MKSVMEDVFRGEFAPFEYVGANDAEFSRLNLRTDRMSAALKAKLSDELCAELLALQSEWTRMEFRGNMLAYIDGFRFGLRVMAEAIDAAH